MENQVESELDRIKLIVRQSQPLTGPRETVCKLIAAIDKEDSSAIQLERIIISDPLLATDFMCLGLTMGWSRHRSEASIRMLIVRLGFRTIRSLALSLLSRRMTATEQTKSFDSKRYGQMCFVTAVLTRYFSARTKMTTESKLEFSADELFAVGLISQMGLALLANHAPEIYERCFVLAKRLGTTIDDAFKVVYGGSVDELTALAIEIWALPEVFQQTISNLATPCDEDGIGEAIACIITAKKVAAELGFQMETWPCTLERPDEFAEAFATTQVEIESLQAHINETMSLYFDPCQAA